MNATRHIEQDDLALFAMQLLSAKESAEVLAHVEGCAECRQALSMIQGELAIYAHTAELHSPPAQTRDRLMKQVAREKKVLPMVAINRAAASEDATTHEESDRVVGMFRNSGYSIDEEELPKSNKVLKMLPWAGWAVAAGLAVTAGTFYHQRDDARSRADLQAGQMALLTADAAAAKRLMETMTDSTAMRVTLKKSDAAPVPQGRTTYVPETGSLVFIASNMEPLQQYKVYELWLIPANGQDPVPAGTFHPDKAGNASVILPELPKGLDAKAFGITIEDEGGSKTPTMPIVMSGA